jgi:hypothetical protein
VPANLNFEKTPVIPAQDNQVRLSTRHHERSRRFAMWALMHILGTAPDLDVAFKEATDQNAARDFMDMLARVNED